MADILIYDMEVFKHDWFITIKSLKTHEYTQIHNNIEEIKLFYEQNKNNIWAGHNNTRYDNVILKCLLINITCPKLKEISDKIISEDAENLIKKKYNLKSIQLYSLDMMQDAIRYSLKEIEGYLGASIEECSIPFDLDRGLTQEEVKEVFEYNKHDVDSTCEEIELRFERLMNKIRLLKECNYSLDYLEYTNQKLCAEILNANYTKFDDGLQPYDASIAPIEIHKYKECIDFFTKCDKLDYSKKLKLNIANVPHILSGGGIHGALENFFYFGEIWLIDVSSYYPNLMINFNLCSRAMSNPDNFKNLVSTRMNFKNQKSKYAELAKSSNDETTKNQYLEISKQYSHQSDALKLPINTTSGAMKAPFSKLFDERNNNWMCITGQLLLVDLIESMEDYMSLLQSNTDGIAIIPHNKEKCDEAIAAWEKKTGLILEKTIATAIFQKDVNNYILQTNTGKIKTKGAYVAQYRNEEYHFADVLRRNCEILDDAIVDYLLFKKPLEETICNKNEKLIKYQIIKKLGGMYDDVVLYKYDDAGNLIYDKNVNRVNRIFATTDSHFGKLMKKHNKKNKYDSVEGCPDKCLVYNKDIRSMCSKDISIDYDWYINEAKNKIIDFILSNDEKKIDEDRWLVANVKLQRV